MLCSSWAEGNAVVLEITVGSRDVLEFSRKGEITACLCADGTIQERKSLEDVLQGARVAGTRNTELGGPRLRDSQSRYRREGRGLGHTSWKVGTWAGRSSGKFHPTASIV